MIKVTKDTTNSAFRSGFLGLVLTALFLGFAESLSVFFVDHIRVEAGSPWLSELFKTIVSGSLISGITALAIGLVLMFMVKAPVLNGRLKFLRGEVALIAVYMIMRLYISGAENVIRFTGAGLFLSLLIVIGVGNPLAKYRSLLRFWPVVVSVLVGLGMWFSISKVAMKRFENDEIIPAMLGAIVPVLLLGIAWALSFQSKRRLKAVFFGVAFSLTLLLLVALMPAAAAQPPKDRPNVVMIVVDTLRADRVWGSEAVMPMVKELSEDGVYFMNAYTPIAKTQQSVASFMTGLNPWHTGVRTLYDRLGRDYDTLAEKFSRAGYKTAAFVHNPWIDYGMGHEQGFHQYFDYEKMESISMLLHNLMPIRLLDRTIGSLAGANRFQTDGKIMTDHVLDWLDSNDDDPFFIWIHYFDPHWPYEPPPETPGVTLEDYKTAARINNMKGKLQRSDVIFHGDTSGITEDETAAASRLYSGEAAYTDSQIGRIAKVASGIGDTTFVFTSDHGESLGEHDYYFHHGEFTYNACLKVPLFVSGKGVAARHKVVDTPVSTMDIVPTLVEMFALEESKLDSRVLPNVINRSKGDPKRPLAFESDVRMFDANDRIFFKGLKGKWRGVIRGRKKAIVIPHPEGAHYEVYDLFTDSAEKQNLYTTAGKLLPELIDEMKKLGLKVETMPSFEIKNEPEQNLSQSEIDRLRALGYVQ